MRHPDARTLAPSAQAEKRRIAMTMREAGESFSVIGRTLGVHYMTVSAWWDRYQVGGLDALAPQKRGPKVGARRRLTTRQEQAVQRAITDTTPDQLKLPFALWTRAAIVQLIARRFGLTLPVRTMGHYLKRWGSPRRSRSSAPTSSGRRRSRRGSRPSTHASSGARWPRVRRFIGATRPA